MVVPISHRCLACGVSSFFATVRPGVTRTFCGGFSTTTLLGASGPFPRSLSRSMITTSGIVGNPLDCSGVLTLRSLLKRGRFRPGTFVSGQGGHARLHTTTRAINSGMRFVCSHTTGAVSNFPITSLGTLRGNGLCTKSFSCVFCNVPFGVSFGVSRRTRLSALAGRSKAPIGLFRRRLLTLHYAVSMNFVVIGSRTFTGVDPGT